MKTQQQNLKKLSRTVDPIVCLPVRKTMRSKKYKNRKIVGKIKTKERNQSLLKHTASGTRKATLSQK